MEKQVCAPLAGANHLGNLNKNKKTFLKAFSLIELMISLIIISLIAAAFVPVITKKLVRSSIVAGSFGSNSSGGVSEKCSNISEDCALCAGDTCLSCKNKCDTGETLNTSNCSCELKVPYYMAVDGLYVTKYNMGDGSRTKIPAEAGVTIVYGESRCGSSSNYSAKCCWQGATLSADCDAKNGNYSGCTRTVCNWAAANAICANYKQDGKTWRLPTTSEMANWGTYSKGKGNDGLMLCDYSSGYSSAHCKFTDSCLGSYNGLCIPHFVWSGSIYNSSSTYKYSLVDGNWVKNNYSATAPSSVRCVSEIVSNCETYDSDGETCTACKSGYYLKNDECEKYTIVSNCKTYASAEDKCETCKDGYYLLNNQCKARTTVANCATYSATEDKCESCSSGYKLSNNTCVSEFDCSGQYFMKIGSLCVTKYNMGDGTETAIPSAAGVSVVGVGTSCGSSSDYYSKCCWQGATSKTDCNSTNADYSGCNRTVCNWAAANAICTNFKKGDKTWRLPTATEMLNWPNYSQINNGLMLCDDHQVYNSPYCGGYGSCGRNYCYPYGVWSSTYGSTDVYYHYLSQGSWVRDFDGPTNAFSVRCVTEM